MFYIGKNVRASPPEQLIPTTADALVATIKDSGSELARETTRLRRIAQIDPKTFKSMKTTLPYFIAATFVDNLRHSDNFIEINALILDFDNCLKTPAQSHDLKKQITSHPEVFMAFVSPNGSGLKIVLRLAEPLSNLPLFKQFYLDYARQFAEHVRLLGTLDTRTSDATRVCFLVHDPNLCYNPNALPLNWQLWAAKNQLDANAAADKQPTPLETTKPKLSPELHRELVLKINPKAPVKPPREPHVPLLLQELEEPLRQLLQENGIEVLEIRPIHYGLKLCCKLAPQLAEVNVFYGKRGFSVVMSPKAATSPDLNKRVYALVFAYFFNTPPDAT